MKILILSHMFPSKNAPYYGVFVWNQIKALSKIEINTKVISPVPYAPKVLWFNKKWKNYGSFPKEEEIGSIRVLRPRYVSFPKRFLFERSGWFYYFGIKSALKKILDQNEINLVHAHTVLPDGQAALFIKKSFKIPYVVTIHGDDLYNTINESNVRKETIGDVLKSSKKIIVVSNNLKKIVQNRFPEISQENVVVVNNGVDLSEFKSVPRKFPTDRKFMILSIATLIERKGHRIVLNAVSKIAKEFPIEYNIVGDGPEKSKLEQQVKEKSLGNVVKFFGFRPYSEIPRFLKKANLFVLPSWNEAFGVVYLEAMASGLPVIGCKGEGVEDIVKDGEGGLLVKSRDSEDLYNAIKKVLSPLLYESMSNQALEISKTFTWKENAKKTAKIYNDVLNREEPFIDDAVVM